jgi:hypothetical protein
MQYRISSPPWHRIVNAVAFTFAFAIATGEASASCIGVFPEANGVGCQMVVSTGTPVTWYIYLIVFGDEATSGITGAEFRQDGVPNDWVVTATPNPAVSTSIGNPLAGGVDIVFPSCQPGLGDRLLLYTVHGLATSAYHGLFQIAAHSSPANPKFDCALVTLCDPPDFTKLCVLEACMHVSTFGVIKDRQCCPLAVEPANWSGIKRLYER